MIKMMKKLIKEILEKFIKLINRILGRLIEMVKRMLIKFIEIIGIISNKLVKRIKIITDKIMRVMKIVINKMKYLKGIMYKYDYDKLIIILLILIESILITWWILPELIFNIFGIMRSNILENTSNYIIYRCISLPIMYSMRESLRTAIQDLVKHYLLFGLLSVSFTVLWFVLC